MHRIVFSIVLFLAACGGRSQPPPVAPPPPPPTTGECIRTGCSNEVCADEQVITTCVFRPEFACYKDATCERQANGKCGWTESAELSACLANPPAE
jgi:eight-cysteine-cluster-containing protein